MLDCGKLPSGSRLGSALSASDESRNAVRAALLDSLPAEVYYWVVKGHLWLEGLRCPKRIRLSSAALLTPEMTKGWHRSIGSTPPTGSVGTAGMARRAVATT